MLNKNPKNTPNIHTQIHPDILALANQVPLIIGVDEVGRGCLFGQMTVAACILPPTLACTLNETNTLNDTALAKLTDSKKLSKKTRITLSHTIKSLASYSLVDIPADIIDNINIHQATLLGMSHAISTLIDSHQLSASMVQILIDGNQMPTLATRHQAHQASCHTLIKGDSHHASIAAASILAKVTRDDAMLAFAKVYPHFGLEKHKGYPTSAHKKALAKYGILPEHRKSYAPVKNIHQQSSSQSVQNN